MVLGINIMNCDVKKLNTIVNGFETADCPGTVQLLQSEGLIDVKVWIGDSDVCTINIFDLFDVKVPIVDTQIPEELYKRLHRKLHLFETAYSRKFVLDGTINVSLCLNVFNIYVKYFYELVVSNRIELMLFSNIPHEGPDILLYDIAQHMNIQTIICTQSLFTNLFFIVRNIEDFGEFATSNKINNTTIQETIDSLKIFERPLFYMKGVSPLSLKNRILLMIKSIPSFSGLQKSHAVYEFYKYTTRLNRLVCKSIDLSANYIYFPLHLQPELTTVPLGNEYFDQALALEELHAILPPGWKIYVKENPLQTEYMRDQFFFARVEALKNLVWVPRDYDTYTLTRSCKIVATITGTAGWEALLQNKPVIVFGSAWYKNFPKVFAFSREMDLLLVANELIDTQELQHLLNLMQNKMGTGVVDPAYSTLVEQYSPEQNGRHVAESLRRYINDET